MPQLKIAVIGIGDELLKGFTVNTNLSDIGHTMTQAGLMIHESAIIPDKPEAIVEMIERLFKHGSDIIITSGGLGPTLDDLTKQTIAESLGLALQNDEGIIESLKKYWGARDLPMPDSVLSQGLIPEGAKWFPNEVGTAPGILVKVEKFSKQEYSAPDLPCIIMLPGPPSELNPMFNNYVLPFLLEAEPHKRFTETIHVSGLPESIVEERTKDIVAASPELSIAYCASPEAVKVYLSGDDAKLVQNKKSELEAVLSDRILPDGISSPAEHIVKLFHDRQLSLATAESCTGGMIAAAITDVPGSSEIFKGSVVSYSNEWKENLLKVTASTLIEYGAVSAAVAEEMVENLCSLYGSDAGISVTGIAGPGGGTVEKPLGLVHIGVKFKDKTVLKQYNFPGGRRRIRRRTVSTALNILVDLIKEA